MAGSLVQALGTAAPEEALRGDPLAEVDRRLGSRLRLSRGVYDVRLTIDKEATGAVAVPPSPPSG